jgi:serine/threonine protein kinase/tetratricopeptide (TPR) repeat protein/TolB-like protein
MGEKWEQIKEIFTLALEKSPEDRIRFVEQACAGDEALRSEIESLLSNYEGDQCFLEESPASELSSARTQRMAGRRIGAYRIISRCGQGGMAEVYLAERADNEYRQRVAIKMVAYGANSEEILRRFRNERQALAGLVHPNIVRLLDGGSSDEGMPYIVMDYVDGIQVDEYCDMRRLTVPERLRLFQTVCDAVQFAHDHLVIHRDLKPSNILITADGIPRLLDFGIAKVLNPELLSNQALTRTDWRPMTPQYASPEQVRGNAVTNASDIYSLGVLLYELLTSHRPYRWEGESSLSLERSICEEEPEKPSTAISRMDQQPSHADSECITAETVARTRATRADDLRRSLRGDLDTIVLKAIRKEPRERYSSVKEFSEDIERYLKGLPIRARRPTLTYRAGKFVRRHQESAATAIFVLIIAIALGTWQMVRVARQLRAAGSESSQIRVRPSLAILGFKNLSDRPETAWVSTALSEMLLSEMGAGEQLHAIPGEVVARTEIDLGLHDTESLSPEMLASVHKNLASEYLILGSYMDADGIVRLDLRLLDAVKGETIVTASDTAPEKSLAELVSRVGSRLRQQFGVGQLSQVESAAVFAEAPSNPDAARSYYQGLARLRSFDSLGAKDLLTRAVAADKAFPLASSALATAWSSLGYDPQAKAAAKNALDRAGNLSREKHLLVEGEYYEAGKQWEKAIDTYRTLASFFPDNLEYGLDLANAQILGQKGQDALATIDRLRKLPAPSKDDPRIDGMEQEAASLLSDNKRSLEAGDRVIQKAKAAGANLVAARAQSFQCRTLADVGRPQESRASCEEARRLYRQAGDLLGESRTLHGMAEVPLDQGDLEGARQLYNEALAICRKIGNKRCIEHEIGNLGLVFRYEGDFETSERMYRQAIDMAREVDDKQAMSVEIGNLADLLYTEGRWKEALAQIQVALKLAQETGHKLGESIQILNTGEILAEQGDLNGAMRNYDQAMNIQRSIGSRSYYAGSLNSLGQLFRQKGDADGARKTLNEALSIRQELGEKGATADTQLALSDLASDSHQAGEAEALARSAIAVYQAEKQSDREIQAQASLMRALLEANKLDQAREEMGTALQKAARSHDVTTRLTMSLEEAYVHAALHDLVGAERIVHGVKAEAGKIGFTRMQLEAELAYGEFELSRNHGAGNARLHALEQTAHQRGFELIAQKASAGAPFPLLSRK